MPLWMGGESFEISSEYVSISFGCQTGLHDADSCGWVAVTGKASSSRWMGERRGNLRSIEAAAVAGIVYSVLAVCSMSVFLVTPDLGMSDSELSEWYSAGGTSNVLVGLNLATVSSIAFLWFVAVIRRRIGEREDRFFSTVFTGSATLYVAVWLVGAALLAAPAIALAAQESADVSRSGVSMTLGAAAGLILVVAPRLQAVFVIATSTLLLRTSAMPRWVSWFGYVVGIALFIVPNIYRFLGVGLPLWVLIVSITLLILRRRPELIDN